MKNSLSYNQCHWGGLDEVGRGALYGPLVIVGCYFFPSTEKSFLFLNSQQASFPIASQYLSFPIQDSKTLTHKTRQHIIKKLFASSQADHLQKHIHSLFLESLTASNLSKTLFDYSFHIPASTVFPDLKDHSSLFIHLVWAHAAFVDAKKNILKSTMSCMYHSIHIAAKEFCRQWKDSHLCLNKPITDFRNIHFDIDGPFIPLNSEGNHSRQNQIYPIKNMTASPSSPQIFLSPRIQGDQNWVLIALASNLAKSFRDHWIHLMALNEPASYQLSKNVGYGTLTHRKALQNQGSLKHHRRSFTQNILSCANL